MTISKLAEIKRAKHVCLTSVDKSGPTYDKRAWRTGTVSNSSLFYLKANDAPIFVYCARAKHVCRTSEVRP